MDGEAFLEARLAHYAEALASPPARAAASPVPILWTRPVISVNCRRRSGGGGPCHCRLAAPGRRPAAVGYGNAGSLECHAVECDG